MAKSKKTGVRETTAITYINGAVPIDPALLKSFLEVEAVKGYIQREGALSDGNGFSQVYLVIDTEKVKGL